MKKIVFILLFLIGTIVNMQSQTQTDLTYESFLNKVKESNVNYIIEKYNVGIAEANAEAAKVFQNPNLSIGAADNQERTLKMGYNFDAGLDYTLELGNKRKARMQLAKSESDLTKSLLENYFRNLQADATLSYFSVLKQKQLWIVQQASYEEMKRLAQADSVRFRLGSIMEIDSKQSKLEAGTLLNEVLQLEADYRNGLIQLSFLQGDSLLEGVSTLTGELPFFKRKFDLFTLITNAQNNRSDLQAALKSKEVSQRNLQLVKANRAIDLGLSLGVSRNAEVRNEIAPAPAYTSVSAGVSIPLKFSNTNKGELKAAKMAIEQSEASYKAVEMQIRSEVIQAFQNYQTTCRQVELFDTDLLADAKIIFDKKKYSYERGETSLLEVINARRTYNDVLKNYYEALFNCTATLIELERATGMWDIAF